MSGDAPDRDPAARGRTFGVLVFGILVGGITLVLSAQILRETFAPEPPQSELACPEAVESLWAALVRARQSAAEQAEELASVAAFRRALLPEWELAPALETLCGAESRQLRAASALIRLRYAEESAARFGSRDLSAARQQVVELVDELAGRPKAVSPKAAERP